MYSLDSPKERFHLLYILDALMCRKKRRGAGYIERYRHMTMDEIEVEISRLDAQITACKEARRTSCQEWMEQNPITTSVFPHNYVVPFGKLERSV